MPSQTNIEDLTGKTPETPKGKPSSKRRTSSASSARADGDLRGRLEQCFERIAQALYEREDAELADLISEDASVMAAGLVSLTRPFKAFRTPLLVLISVVEPALAFGRVARMLAHRVQVRRWERAQANAEQVPEPDYAVTQ